MSDFVFIYITASTEEEAAAIGRKLVEQKLAACVNILPNMRSIYSWEGKVEDNKEVVLIAKTRAVLFDDVEMCVKSLSSYSTPCIVALPVKNGSPEYLEWIDQATV